MSFILLIIILLIIFTIPGRLQEQNKISLCHWLYAAELRLSQSMPADAKEARVVKILQVLGLDDGAGGGPDRAATRTRSRCRARSDVAAVALAVAVCLHFFLCAKPQKLTRLCCACRHRYPELRPGLLLRSVGGHPTQGQTAPLVLQRIETARHMRAASTSPAQEADGEEHTLTFAPPILPEQPEAGGEPAPEDAPPSPGPIRTPTIAPPNAAVRAVPVRSTETSSSAFGSLGEKVFAQLKRLSVNTGADL